jgi:hypothetical protein
MGFHLQHAAIARHTVRQLPLGIDQELHVIATLHTTTPAQSQQVKCMAVR